VELQGSSKRCSQIKEEINKQQQANNSNNSCSLQHNRLQFIPTKLSTSLRQAHEIAATFVSDQVRCIEFDLDGSLLSSGTFDDFCDPISDSLKLLQVDKKSISAANMSMKVCGAVDSFNNDGNGVKNTDFTS